MKRTLMLLAAALPISMSASCGTARSIWRDWQNTDLAGRQAPALDDGVWLLPPDELEYAREAPEGWAPPASKWRLVAFLQPH